VSAIRTMKFERETGTAVIRSPLNFLLLSLVLEVLAIASPFFLQLVVDRVGRSRLFQNSSRHERMRLRI
jgi:ABC-type bacteriocin/lantibiotic exporter with double-glycine peptidase domain